MSLDTTTLYSPLSYQRALPEVRAEVCNGCGTSGWKGALVPDTLYFMSIAAACDIHDWEYTYGSTEEERQAADRAFLNNMLRLINLAGGWSILQRLRRARAYKYYEAVRKFGGPAFWAGKNNNNEA